MAEPPKHPVVLDNHGTERRVTQDDVNALLHVSRQFEQIMKAIETARTIKRAVKH